MNTDILTSSSLFFKYVFPPAFYAFHGWIATEMAIWALFRPYEAWYFPLIKIQVPCTPGIFPKRKSKLAQAVASTVTDTLLTADDIKAKVQKLVTQENIYKAVDIFIDSLVTELRDATKLHKLAQDLAELSPTFLHHIVSSIIDEMENGRDKKVALITEKVFDQFIVSMRISRDQADEIAGRLMDLVFTEERIRTTLVSLLSPQNINSLDQSIQAHAGGPYRILAKIIGVKRVCYEWRNFLEQEPEEAHRIIGDLNSRFGIKEQISLQISSFDMHSLPLTTIDRFRESTIKVVESFLLEQKESIKTIASRLEGEAITTVRSAIIGFNVQSIPSSWLDRTKLELANFCYLYLQRELGELLGKALPALGMYELIERKIDLFSSQQLEFLVKRICKQELKWLAILGGFIGGWLGLVQVAVNVVFP